MSVTHHCVASVRSGGRSKAVRYPPVQDSNRLAAAHTGMLGPGPASHSLYNPLTHAGSPERHPHPRLPPHSRPRASG